MSAVLDRITAYKLEEISAAKRRRPLAHLEMVAAAAAPPRDFARQLLGRSRSGLALIGEIKRSSPSRGRIRDDFVPERLARAYEAGGAACLSVLTDSPSFEGAPEHLTQARNACSLPVLRKDFMLDSYQVVEARAWSADCILVIMAGVTDGQAAELVSTARGFGMETLVEVHNSDELDRALAIDCRLIGINNRDLRTFEVSVDTTRLLAPKVPEDRIVVAESGLGSHADLASLAELGVRCFLVGESLMRQADVEMATRRLLGVEDSTGKGTRTGGESR
ncbi:MAG: indole-3-glycerol phosphate synthase TrpC [Paracoccaceae bacterium]|nr:indole-3-glycerol phosphate synthase TrpC [Paracoccaceae bacterium]